MGYLTIADERASGSASAGGDVAPDDDQPAEGSFEGRVLAGRYRIQRLIGTGGMGLVFLAEQIPTRQPVALKLLRSGRRASDEAVRRALREAKALSAVEHESIVRLLDAGRAETGEAFIALEYLHGLTLKQLLTECSFLPWPWAVGAVCSVLSALETMHASGFVHRDVKPSNCFVVTPGRPLTREPKIKLIDFGIARLLDPLPADLITSKGSTIGTPAYSAPEQLLADRADARSDVYCTGVTLHELLTGKLPSCSLPHSGTAESLRAPSAVNPGAGIPPALDAIVLRALEQDPERRFPSARAMRDALSDFGRPAFVDSAALPISAGARTAFSFAAPDRQRGLGAATVAADSKGSSQEEAQLGRLHAKVERFWISGVLRSSLETAMLVPQERTREDEWIVGLASVLQCPPAAPIEADRAMADIFEESGRSLLLLGEPGTGKTTQMLLLAQALLAAGPRPVPVVLTLATWTDATRSLEAWMCEELYTRYQIPTSFAERWLSQGLVLPLLDGLDEAPAQRRDACVDAINQAVERGSLPGIVVTSRTNEYMALSRRLRLGSAVRQHRLTREVVVEAFARNPVLAGLSGEQREQLLELSESPLALTLLLHVASITLQPGEVGVGAGADEGGLSRLLDAYVERVVSRSGKKRLPVEPERFIGVVEQLAWAMRRNSCAVFQMSSLQPGWLERSVGLHVYALASRILSVGIFGAGLVLSFGNTPLDNQGFNATLGFGCSLWGFTSLVVGSLTGLVALRSMRRPPRERRTRRAHWLHVAGLAVVAGALDGAVLGWWEGHPMAAVMGFEVGLVAAVLVSPHAAIGELSADVRAREALRFSWRHALRIAPVGVALGVVAFLGVSGEADLFAKILPMTYVLVVTVLLGGVRGRKVDDGAARSGAIQRSLRSALVVSLVGGALTAAFMGPHYGLSYGLFTGLTTAITLWLWYGGYTLIQHGVLRALLRWEKHDYCDEQYLDSAADRALLYRVGGGAMFIHPLLRDHLAQRFARRRDAAR